MLEQIMELRQQALDKYRSVEFLTPESASAFAKAVAYNEVAKLLTGNLTVQPRADLDMKVWLPDKKGKK